MIGLRTWVSGATAVVTDAPMLARALRSDRHARKKHAPGLEFASFGRCLGIKLLASAPEAAWQMILWPVSILRYWEFPFARRHLPASPELCCC